MQNMILHLNSFLTTTTTKMLHLIFDCNPPKRFFKIRKLFSCGHYLEHLAGRVWNGAHAENLVGPSPTLGLSAALELHHTS
jgi:hypothetical protein